VDPIVIVDATEEPISVEAAAFNLGVDDDGNSPPSIPEPFATRIAGLIKAARESCEQELESTLPRKTLEVAQDSWWLPDQCQRGIELPWGPVREIVSVTYVDADGNDQVLADDQYRYSRYGRTPMLVPVWGVTWPSVRCDTDSVRVQYEAGYPSDDSPAQEIPEPIIEAMHLLIAHGWKNREAVDDGKFAELPLGVRAKLAPYRRALGV